VYTACTQCETILPRCGRRTQVAEAKPKANQGNGPLKSVYESVKLYPRHLSACKHSQSPDYNTCNCLQQGASARTERVHSRHYPVVGGLCATSFHSCTKLHVLKSNPPLKSELLRRGSYCTRPRMSNINAFSTGRVVRLRTFWAAKAR
jgi:hypothetical protein